METITINTVGLDQQRRMHDGRILQRWKDEIRFEGSYATKHQYMDFEIASDSKKEMNWKSIMNNIIHS